MLYIRLMRNREPYVFEITGEIKNNDYFTVTAYKSENKYSSAVVNGKQLEVRLLFSTTADSGILYDPDALQKTEIHSWAGYFGYDSPKDHYSASGPYGELITEEAYLGFLQQVDLIVAAGKTVDSYTNTISYDELIGDETPEPGITEVMADLDWKQNTQFPDERTLNLSYDGTLHTLPFAESAVIHFYGDDGDAGLIEYGSHVRAWDDFIAQHTIYITAFVQIKNGEIMAMWVPRLDRVENIPCYILLRFRV